MKAQLASVGLPRAPVGLPEVAHGVPKDAQGTPSLPFRSYRNGPWTHSRFFYVPTHVSATYHFSLHFSQVVTFSFHSNFVEIHIGRLWGPLGVPRTLLDAPWTSPWTPLGPPSAPMAPEVCSNAGETGFSMKNERLACMRAQLAPPRASVGPPRASVGLPKVAHGVPKDAQGTPSLPFRSYRNGPWTHSWFFYVPTHVNATCHFSLHFSQVGAGGRGRSP